MKLIQILHRLHRTGWIKTRPAQKLLVRVKFTGNSYSTCVNMNGHHWNTCKLVFTGTCIQVAGLVLRWMWTHPKAGCDGSKSSPGSTFSNLLKKILGRFLILGQSLTISGNALTRPNFALITNSRFNKNRPDKKNKELITIIIQSLSSS